MESKSPSTMEPAQVPASNPKKRDWKKYVTINPPNIVKFAIEKSTRGRSSSSNSSPRRGRSKSNSQGRSGSGHNSDHEPAPEEVKAKAMINIVNKSGCTILFKVKTTNFNSYLVKPNSDILPMDCECVVNIVTQNGIFSNPELCMDKFLVQLAALNDSYDTIQPGQLKLFDIQQLWDAQQNRKEVVSYKLKVDIHQSVNIFMMQHAKHTIKNLEAVSKEPKKNAKAKEEAKGNSHRSAQRDRSGSLLARADAAKLPPRTGISAPGRVGGRTNSMTGIGQGTKALSQLKPLVQIQTGLHNRSNTQPDPASLEPTMMLMEDITEKDSEYNLTSKKQTPQGSINKGDGSSLRSSLQQLDPNPDNAPDGSVRMFSEKQQKEAKSMFHDSVDEDNQLRIPVEGVSPTTKLNLNKAQYQLSKPQTSQEIPRSIIDLQNQRKSVELYNATRWTPTRKDENLPATNQKIETVAKEEPKKTGEIQILQSESTKTTIKPPSSKLEQPTSAYSSPIAKQTSSPASKKSTPQSSEDMARAQRVQAIMDKLKNRQQEDSFEATPSDQKDSDNNPVDQILQETQKTAKNALEPRPFITDSPEQNQEDFKALQDKQKMTSSEEMEQIPQEKTSFINQMTFDSVEQLKSKEELREHFQSQTLEQEEDHTVALQKMQKEREDKGRRAVLELQNQERSEEQRTAFILKSRRIQEEKERLLKEAEVREQNKKDENAIQKLRQEREYAAQVALQQRRRDQEEADKAKQISELHEEQKQEDYEGFIEDPIEKRKRERAQQIKSLLQSVKHAEEPDDSQEPMRPQQPEQIGKKNYDKGQQIQELLQSTMNDHEEEQKALDTEADAKQKVIEEMARKETQKLLEKEINAGSMEEIYRSKLKSAAFKYEMQKPLEEEPLSSEKKPGELTARPFIEQKEIMPQQVDRVNDQVSSGEEDVQIMNTAPFGQQRLERPPQEADAAKDRLEQMMQEERRSRQTGPQSRKGETLIGQQTAFNDKEEAQIMEAQLFADALHNKMNQEQKQADAGKPKSKSRERKKVSLNTIEQKRSAIQDILAEIKGRQTDNIDSPRMNNQNEKANGEQTVAINLHTPKSSRRSNSHKRQTSQGDVDVMHSNNEIIVQPNVGQIVFQPKNVSADQPINLRYSSKKDYENNAGAARPGSVPRPAGSRPDGGGASSPQRQQQTPPNAWQQQLYGSNRKKNSSKHGHESQGQSEKFDDQDEVIIERLDHEENSSQENYVIVKTSLLQPATTMVNRSSGIGSLQQLLMNKDTESRGTVIVQNRSQGSILGMAAQNNSVQGSLLQGAVVVGTNSHMSGDKVMSSSDEDNFKNMQSSSSLRLKEPNQQRPIKIPKSPELQVFLNESDEDLRQVLNNDRYKIRDDKAFEDIEKLEMFSNQEQDFKQINDHEQFDFKIEQANKRNMLDITPPDFLRKGTLMRIDKPTSYVTDDQYYNEIEKANAGAARDVNELTARLRDINESPIIRTREIDSKFQLGQFLNSEGRSSDQKTFNSRLDTNEKQEILKNTPFDLEDSIKDSTKEDGKFLAQPIWRANSNQPLRTNTASKQSSPLRDNSTSRQRISKESPLMDQSEKTIQKIKLFGGCESSEIDKGSFMQSDENAGSPMRETKSQTSPIKLNTILKQMKKEREEHENFETLPFFEHQHQGHKQDEEMKQIFEAQVFANVLSAKKNMLMEIDNELQISNQTQSQQQKQDSVEKVKKFKVEQAQLVLEQMENREKEAKLKREQEENEALEKPNSPEKSPVVAGSFFTSLTSMIKPIFALRAPQPMPNQNPNSDEQDELAKKDENQKEDEAKSNSRIAQNERDLQNKIQYELIYSKMRNDQEKKEKELKDRKEKAQKIQAILQDMSKEKSAKVVEKTPEKAGKGGKVISSKSSEQGQSKVDKKPRVAFQARPAKHQSPAANDASLKKPENVVLSKENSPTKQGLLSAAVSKVSPTPTKLFQANNNALSPIQSNNANNQLLEQAMPIIFNENYSNAQTFNNFVKSNKGKLKTQTLKLPLENTKYDEINRLIAYKNNSQLLKEEKSLDDLRKPRSEDTQMISRRTQRPEPVKIRKPLPFEIDKQVTDTGFLQQIQANEDLEIKLQIAQQRKTDLEKRVVHMKAMMQQLNQSCQDEELETEAESSDVSFRGQTRQQQRQICTSDDSCKAAADVNGFQLTLICLTSFIAGAVLTRMLHSIF